MRSASHKHLSQHISYGDDAISKSEASRAVNNALSSAMQVIHDKMVRSGKASGVLGGGGAVLKGPPGLQDPMRQLPRMSPQIPPAQIEMDIDPMSKLPSMSAFMPQIPPSQLNMDIINVRQALEEHNARMAQGVGHTEAERRVDDRSLVVSEASGQPQSTVWSEKTVVLDEAPPNFWRNLQQ